MKKSLFGKAKKMYRITLLLIVFSLVMSSIPAGAVTVNSGNFRRIQLNSGKTVTLTIQQLDGIINVTADEAEEIAKLFIADAINIGNVCWDKNTEVTSVVYMYDTDGEISAYTVRLTTGYVVVSAHLDTEIQILEWSDKADPLCEELEANTNDKIVYLGGYEYYVDDGTDELTDINGEKINKASTVNQIDCLRNIDNIPEVAYSQYMSDNRASTNSYIDNMYTHANQNYAGTFYYVNGYDSWSQYNTSWYTDSYPSSLGHAQPSGPVAITNTLIAFKKRYPGSGSSISSNNNTVFNNVSTNGINNGYYAINSSGGLPAGALPSVMASYTNSASNAYYVYPLVTNMSSGLGTYDRYKTELENNNMLIIYSYRGSNSGTIYPDQYLLCFGYTRLQSNTTGYYLSYLHVADGKNTSIRYVPMAWTLTAHTIIVDY